MSVPAKANRRLCLMALLLSTTALAPCLPIKASLAAAAETHPVSSDAKNNSVAAAPSHEAMSLTSAVALPSPVTISPRLTSSSRQDKPNQSGQSQSLASADGPIAFEAEFVEYDAEAQVVRAYGDVVLRRDGYILRAAEVTYNQATGDAAAKGAVELTLPTGEVIYSQEVALSGALKNAIVSDFRLILTDGAQVAARRGSHQDAEGKTTLNRAVYSPCDICADSDSAPQWRIKAVRVVHDRERRRLTYKNAALELFGIPVMWTPYFSHPDPTVERASGFLPLDIFSRRELGVVIGLPYHVVIDETSDATITPFLTTRENAVIAAEYRKHFGWARLETKGSITYGDQFDEFGNPASGEQFRGHLTAKGWIDHGNDWRSRFDLGWASDDTYLRRYNFSNVDTVVSDYVLEKFAGPSYLSARSLAFQGLRVEDVSGLTAFALPWIEAEYVAPLQPFGGNLTVGGNALSLVRFEGLDTQRISAYANWRKRYIGPKGTLIDLDALVRGDVYNVDDADRPDDPAFGGAGGTDVRGVTRLNAHISWPLAKITSSGTHTLEPSLQLTFQPESGQPDDLVNEDGRAFELNDLNLFSAERSAGYDLIEEGIRATYGVTWGYQTGALDSSVFIGQAMRITGDGDQFISGVGLEGNSSDIVGRIDVKYQDWLDYQHNFRINENSFGARRNEARLTLGPSKFNVQFAYFKLDRDLNFINREDREELQIAANWQATENWRFFGRVVEDLTNGNDAILWSAGAGYADECLELTFQVRRTLFRDRDVRPGTQIRFNLSLKNLG